jgi:hypothetical protein
MCVILIYICNSTIKLNLVIEDQILPDILSLGIVDTI